MRERSTERLGAFFDEGNRMMKTRLKGNYKKFQGKRKMAFTLAALLAVMAVLPYVPLLETEAGDIGEQIVLTTAHGNYAGGKLYCIDKNPYHQWGVADDGDKYERHDPHALNLPLSERQLDYAFWGMLSLKAAQGDSRALGVIAAINTSDSGVLITKFVTEEDLKIIVHDAGYRAKYPWLETVASNSEEYMRKGGLIPSGGGMSVGGSTVPSILSSSTSTSSAYSVDMGTKTINFGVGASDFIQKVPLLFSNDNGVTWNPTVDGWTYQKMADSIIFTNPNPAATGVLVKFAVEETPYAFAGGSYSSRDEVIEKCLHIYECVACSGGHAGSAPPTLEGYLHQRLINVVIETMPVSYFAALGAGTGGTSGSGGSGGGYVNFQAYRHAEDFTATYNVQLYKYDHETGKPLEGAKFALYERFDDKDEVNTFNDGAAELYEGGGSYAGGYLDGTVLWDGFRNVGSISTDGSGRGSQTIEHKYHYDKTFCDGHPAPGFVPVPEPEEEEDEEGNSEIVNQDEIDAAQAENMALAETWLTCYADCKAKEGELSGVHFHWLMDGVSEGEISGIAESGGSEGETPDAGPTESADGATSYDSSGCKTDCEATFAKFIAMKYSYVWEEFKARDGYIIHDTHSDDLPIEVITTDSSENGANAAFGGSYGKGAVSGASTFALRRPSRRNASEGSTGVSAAPAFSMFGLRRRSVQPEETFLDPWQPLTVCQLMVNYMGLQTAAASPSDAEMATPSQGIATEAEIVEKESPEADAAASEPISVSVSSHDVFRSFSPLLISNFLFVDEDEGEIPEEDEDDSSVIDGARLSAGSDAAMASPSAATFAFTRTAAFSTPMLLAAGGGGGEALFPPAYEAALVKSSEGADITPGDPGNYSHCSGADGEGDAWRVYDHRTEGEFHINKRDLDLQQNETAPDRSYGDTQGDATLEGAVYGLFAADDITHPDGKTGVVYKANNLVAVATTDKNGDASFLVNTEAPGKTYDYAAGAIVNTPDGWNAAAPKNLCVADCTYDDYTEDGQYERSYANNEGKNGNCWIGRPLLLGDYYVKELSRSEGYELSIGNKLHALTNNGQDVNAQAPVSATGYAHVSSQMLAEEQTGDGSDGLPRPNDIFFSAESKDTADGTYDLVLMGLPAGTRIYRKDVGTQTVTVNVGTGTYHAVETGNYVVAENDYQYLKYDASGNPLTVETPINYVANHFLQVAERPIDAAKVTLVMQTLEGGMTTAENTAKLAKDFEVTDFLYVKSKVETSLRRNGKQSPKEKQVNGTYDYSTITDGIYDNGVRVGEIDTYGLSGVAPGQPASKTVYGAPVQTVSIPKASGGANLTVGSAITSLLDYYNTNAWLSFGGLHKVEETSTDFLFTVYASVSGLPDTYMVLGSDPETDSIIYHASPYDPADTSLSPRMIYVPYSNNPANVAFGTYTDYSEYASGTSVVGTATLVTDAVVSGTGVVTSKKKTENVYYHTGETPRDSDGNLIREVVYEEITTTETRTIEDVTWVELASTRNADGTYVVNVDAVFNDSYGQAQTNQGILQTLEFKAVVPQESVTLSAADVLVLGDGYIAGWPMNGAAYYTMVKKARAKAYLDYTNLSMVGDDTYIQMASLVYPGERIIYQDAGTRAKAAGVNERIIRQQVKIVKDIRTTPEKTYAHNTMAESGRLDSFTAGRGALTDAASALPQFRFKAYLKSNLERLYRDENGAVTWLDRNGTPVDIAGYQEEYPSLNPYVSVRKLYTKVPHKADSLTAGSLNNNLWDTAITANDSLYSYESGFIKAAQSPGYTRILETILTKQEDGAGATRMVETYNYKKFFDALRVANEDKWDSTGRNTSFKPLAWIRADIFGTAGGEKQDPVLHNNTEIINTRNTGSAAAENALRSDNVRQFAITWYLKDEAAKYMEDNGSGRTQPRDGAEDYSDDIYDQALYQAILKAENYLKPFFAYDLDEIYALEWDSAAGGGSDGDRTTLSADTYYAATGTALETPLDGYYYGVSKYLPYGTYVAVEQQPGNGALGDFDNQHYQTDDPKEISVPSVYEAGGNRISPEKFSEFYRYTASDTPEQLAARYQIRMNEEWSGTHTDDLRGYVIRAHNDDGDFEVYKYGLDIDKRTGTITYSGGSYSYPGFTVTQQTYDPYKDMYEVENTASDYRVNQAVEKYYHYGSISERATRSNNVRYPYGAGRDDNNPAGYYFKDNVATITGSLTGYDGRYFAALVPMTVTSPAESAAYDSAAFTGFADGKYRNTFYTAKLRIEKLDSETGENLLHDEAVFALYAASRDTSAGSEGKVLFYETDTAVTASKEFLEAMGARDITPADFTALIPSTFPWRVPYRGRYTGIIPAGTPICNEAEQIVLKDESGKETGTFRVFTTQTDTEETGEPGHQNVGYLVTPQPLGAGTYVLCELSAPAGYVKSKPVAIEIYSDEVAYYLNGDRDSRVAAAIYETPVTLTADNSGPIVNSDGTTPNGNKPQDFGDIARIYVNNTPIRLEVSKVKQEETELLYELSGRLEGSLTRLQSLYGLENLQLAYNASGTYLGYGWPKGYLESLKARQAAGETIDLLYEDSVFTGRAIYHVVPETAADTNRYLPGAKMTLYDAIEVVPNGDSEDRAYAGVNVLRDSFGNVTRMYVEKGYAGTKTIYVKDKDDAADPDYDFTRYAYADETEDTGTGTWTLKTVEREDSDILYYDLGGLSVLYTQDGKLFGYDKNGDSKKTKDGASLYAMKNGSPFLEIVCPSYENLIYSRIDRRFTAVPYGTEFYHLDLNGNRDACVEPYTGMAYVTEEATGKMLVWPVKISKDAYGNLIAKEKIKTSRIAAINADSEEEYITGTYDGTRLTKEVNPVLNPDGLPVFYQRTEQTYLKGRAVYDRDGDYVRYKYDDLLKDFNRGSFTVNRRLELFSIGAAPETAADDLPLYRRAGESYVIENTWITGENTPNDPFDTAVVTKGQVDVLKRVPKGLYIMEEVAAPYGWTKAMPVGLTVEESCEIQTARMIDRPIGVSIEKVDAPEKFKKEVLDCNGILTLPETRIEGVGSYTYESVAGARLALYPARKVTTSDLANHPSGYYLVKTQTTPLTYKVLSDDNTKVTVTAEWTVGDTPQYFEGIPSGAYILEEIHALPGYLPSSMEVEISADAGLQTFTLPNDHTKVEILKYEVTESAGLTEKTPLANAHAAGLTLYPAKRDAAGLVLMDSDGNPLYDETAPVTSWTTDDCKAYTEGPDSFVEQFKTLTGEYGNSFVTLTWKGTTASKESDTTTDRSESSRQLWDLGNGAQALVTVEKNLLRDGQPGYIYDFKFNYRKEGTLVTYDTLEGRHRVDYLPITDLRNRKGYYVLAETKTPAGYRNAAPMLLVMEETAEIQLFGMENRERALSVSKIGIETEKQPGIPLPGAELALYRAAEDGRFTEAEEALVDVWTSGTGAHRIAPLTDGIYYLAELTAPPGFAPMEPMRVEWNDAAPEEIQAENRVKTGRLLLTKVDSENREWGLAGALYEIQNEDTGERWQLETGENGRAESGLLQTGKVTENGWLPYHFTLREIRPPKHYVLDRTIHTFSFAETGENPLVVRRELSDEQTRITVAKTDFQTGHLVKGASLAVYRAKENGGSYEAVGKPLDAWISDGNSHVICGKLSAGEVYLLKEEKAPPGYGKKAPVLFALSEDGRQISSISSDCSVISFQTSEEFPENIASVSVWGRKAVEIKRYLTEAESGEERELPAGSSLVLTKEDGLQEGALYEWREETRFNDGSCRVTGRRFFSLHFDEQGEYVPDWRMPEETVLTLFEEEGSEKDETGEEGLLEWTVENREKGYLHTIYNPEYEERNGIATVSANGRLGAAVLPGSVIRYELCAVNTGKEKTDMEVCVQPDAQTEWMPANSDPLWQQEGKTLTARFSGVFPGEEKRMVLAVAVKPEAEGSLCCKAVIQGQEYKEIHPVGEAGSISLRNRVTGTAEKEVNCSFTYHLRFYGKDGQELKGRVPYAVAGSAGSGGDVTGKLRSGEMLCLDKNQSVTFSGLPWGTVCRAEETGDSRRASERMFSSLSDSSAETMAESQPATMLFSYEKRDGSLRELFRRGKQYRLVETVRYSDGQELRTGNCSFTLDEDGAVIRMEFPNEKTKLWIEKTDEESGAAVAGAKLELFRREEKKKENQGGSGKTVLESAKEKLLETWVSDGKQPHLVETAVSPGEKLLLIESTPPDGYGIAEPLEFTVPEEGGAITVSLADRPIHVFVRKLGLSADGVTVLGPVAGAQLRLETEEGTEVYRMTTGNQAEKIPRLLRAGERYRLVEEMAPAGYLPAPPVSFAVPEEGGEVEVVMYDQEKDRRPSGGRSDSTVPKTMTEGTITVHYEEFLNGKASVHLPYRRLSPLPVTGDGKDKENAAAPILFLFSLTLLMMLTGRGKTGEKKGKDRESDDK